MNDATEQPLFLGIDVGTGSARAGLFDAEGTLLGTGRGPVTLWREPGDIVEQSSADIWRAVIKAVQAALAEAGVAPSRIAGVGFDATCSMVVVDGAGAGLAVGPSEDPARDVIVWMDHRATAEAEKINAAGHEVLKYVGGTISPEMQTPKLLWLKTHRPGTFDAAAHFFGLADFLTWKATGDTARSMCTVTCKWTYLAHEKRWDADYFRDIGLGVLADEGFRRIGTRIVEPGTAIGSGLSGRAAEELGLTPGTPVSIGMIDAHAGGIGTVGIGGNPLEQMAYVFGTSSCTMTSTAEPVFIPGVWGPYYSAMVPGLWLSEGGQSAAGAAIDHLISFHPAAAEAARAAEARGMLIPELLTEILLADATDLSAVIRKADGLHVVPEFLGNRAPHADPDARAIIAGLGMERDIESLARLYLAGASGIASGLRQILDAEEAAGAPVARIVISGGAGQSPLLRQLLADATGKHVLAPETAEPVLLGAAILGAVAGGTFADIPAAMRAMSHAGEETTPAGGEIRAVHDARHATFTRLQTLAREIR